MPGLTELYQDLHRHPELSMAETRTAAIVSDTLRAQGWDVTEHVGSTGVVGVLQNGPGPVVLLRADMDGLPVQEDTGLDYASTDTGIDPDGREVPLMHACGHDVHVTCLLGATAIFAADRSTWCGTLVAVFQPGEETAQGAQAMIDDGFLDRFPRPDVCLGQHVGPMPAGTVVTRPGTIMAAADSFRIRLFGRGGHGSSPENTVDPIVMGAAVVGRLQTIVAREVAAGDSAVVTVGSFNSGHKENIIPSEAELKINVRTFDEAVRDNVLHAIHRIVDGEATVSGAPKEPEYTALNNFPLTVNDAAATETVVDALTGAFGPDRVQAMLRPLAGSEDFGVFGDAAGCPSVFWHFGGTDPKLFGDNDTKEIGARSALPAAVPTNHSPFFAPIIDPTLQTGIQALLAAAAAWNSPNM
ncbi:amidohydrolase [Gordonia sp. CPCC 205515]|uniref:amidohydrolase n=1 Tax=Gordonia sp. CPCC 205515 TaxID=3140791 RepID=UPI003AF3429E